mgnify:CR=1 FL=1
MRRTVFLLLTLALLTVPVCAVQLPGELLDALPEEAAALAEGEGITEGGVQLLVQSFFDALRASLDRSLRGAVLLALTVRLYRQYHTLDIDEITALCRKEEET